MRLTCPHCGTRDLREFTVRGGVALRPDSTDWSEDWSDYLHLRDNPAGVSFEHWLHVPCGSWLVVTRDTTTHEVLDVALAGDAA